MFEGNEQIRKESTLLLSIMTDKNKDYKSCDSPVGNI